MAFSSTATLIVRPSGNDANGGGFNPGNVNMATDLATDTNTANTNSPVVSSASYNFVAGDVGARLFVKAAANWLSGWYTIASVAANKATLTASVGNATIYNGTYASGTNTVYNVNNFISGAANYAQGCAKDNSATLTGGTWSIDYSNQNAAQIAYTDMVIGVTTTTYTSVANPVSKNLVGNYINVVSGTGFTVQRVEIVSTATITATCDKSLGTTGSTGGNGNLGGALASPGMAGGVKIASNKIFMLTGTYTVSVNTINVSNGKVDDSLGGTAASPTVWEGFGTIPKDLGAKPTIKCDAVLTGITLFNVSGNHVNAINFIVDGNSQATLTGLSTSQSLFLAYLVDAKNCTTRGIVGGGGVIVRCTATTCSGTAAIDVSAGMAVFCEAYANTITGFLVAAGGGAHCCVASANSGGSSFGFAVTGNGGEFLNGCVAYNNGSHGFNVATTVATLSNCLAEANAGYGYSGTATGEALLLNCGAYNNTSGAINPAIISWPAINFVTNSTGSFFTNPGSGDFSLNNTANQGALARATGFPGVMPRGTSTGYVDIGAIQHQDSGGGTNPIGQVVKVASIGTY